MKTPTLIAALAVGSALAAPVPNPEAEAMAIAAPIAEADPIPVPCRAAGRSGGDGVGCTGWQPTPENLAKLEKQREWSPFGWVPKLWKKIFG